MKQVKKQAWEKFVTIEAKKDPWGLPYKVLRGQNKKELIPSSMKFDEDYEHGTNKLAKKLLDMLLPSDPGGYSEEHLQVIQRMNNITATEETNEITEEEVKDAFFKMGKKKAPGFDDITVEILCKAWSRVKSYMVKIMKRALIEVKFP